jgi:lipopolysaccharide transport system ATP-binding protein
MSTVITVENVGKKYLLQHQSSQQPYVALRDVIAGTCKTFGGRLTSLFAHHSRSSAPGVRQTEEFWALKDVSFQVKQGDRVGIIGRNGAGKSTLLKILSRIAEPTTGTIRIRGRVASLLEVGTGFHPELSGRENIFLNGAILGMSRAEIKRKFDEIVDFAEIERFLDTPVKRYSSGMYVRLAFAVAAHLEPEILVVDEVLAVGDAQFQKKCLGKMEAVSTTEGRTVLFVSHNLSAVQSLCTKGLLLDQGMVRCSAEVSSVVKEYMKSIETQQSSSDLVDRTDRVGGDRLRFTSYRMKNPDSSEPDFVSCGGNCTIELEFHSYEKRLEHLRFGVAIKDKISGKFLVEFNSYYSSYENISCDKGRGKVVFVVERFPLNPGEFAIDIIATTGIEVLDWVKDAGIITVHEGNFYSTGRMPLSNDVVFHYDCTFFWGRN